MTAFLLAPCQVRTVLAVAASEPFIAGATCRLRSSSVPGGLQRSGHLSAPVLLYSMRRPKHLRLNCIKLNSQFSDPYLFLPVFPANVDCIPDLPLSLTAHKIVPTLSSKHIPDATVSPVWTSQPPPPCSHQLQSDPFNSGSPHLPETLCGLVFI